MEKNMWGGQRKEKNMWGVAQKFFFWRVPLKIVFFPGEGPPKYFSLDFLCPPDH